MARGTGNCKDATAARSRGAVSNRSKQVYRYEPVGMDVFDPSASAPPRGTLVVKTNLPGCPPAGTMGHCHIADAESEAFYCLVLEASLQPVTASGEGETKQAYSVDLIADNGAISTFRTNARSAPQAGERTLDYAIVDQGYDPDDGWRVFAVKPV
jgi:hypothetical protein